MGTSDGYIVAGSMTKIVDHGPASSRWNMVILGDGYRSTELSQYHTDVQTFVNAIYNTSPYNERWCGVNIYRADVVSTDSGADDPGTCGDGSTGTGATPNTYYDATFCGDSATRRLLTVQAGRARTDSVALLPQVHVTVVIVNDPQYGGAGDWGNKVASCSTHSSSAEIAIHEIGHAAFLLADEYAGTGGTPASEPTQPNITISTSLGTLKWSSQVAVGTPIPTACNGGCASGCTPPPTPVVGSPVGTYEGAVYTDCGAYRPQPTCKMRVLGVDFCDVCKRVIRDTLAPFMPSESLTLVTPSISFLNVPEGIGGTGVTTYRAVTWEIASCSSKTFRIIAGPTGGFGTPFGTVVPVPVSEITPLTYGRLWLSYTSTTAGATASGTVTVGCDETGQTWVINISANTVPRPKSAAVMVLDRSYSMTEDAGDGRTKVQLLREAAKSFVEVMLEGDGVGLVSFDDQITRLMDVTDVGPAGSGTGRATANTTIDGSGLDPRGATSIGGGIAEGKANIDDAQAAASPPYDVTALVVLTDGNENTPPYIADVSSSITANTFAVGFGLPSNVSTAALSSITQGHNGYLLVTGQITSDIRTRLQKYFLQILAGITNANVILDPPGLLSQGAEHRIPFSVTEADLGLDVILLSPLPNLIGFELETPDGTRITPATMGGMGTVEYIVKPALSFYRLSLPAIIPDPTGSHKGTWYAILRLDSKVEGQLTRQRRFTRQSMASVGQDPAALDALRRGNLSYNLLVHTYSSLFFTAVAQQDQYTPGSEVKLLASLREYDVPVEGRASVWAEITAPDRRPQVVNMPETAPGEFQGSFTTTYSGLYDIRVRARGETFYGTAFTREQNLSAYVFQGRDALRNEPGLPTGTSRNGHDGDILCEMLDCLTRGNVITPRFHELMRGYGLDLQALIDCLTKHCAERNREDMAAALERRQPSAEHRSPSAEDDLIRVVRQMKTEDLRAMLSGLLRDNQ